MQIKSAAVVGAGMAGLATALSLARAGIACDLFEQAPQIGEVGAGLQVSPNAARILDRLGVLSELERQWFEPEAIGLSSGTTLAPLAELPAGTFARRRWGAPYGVLHRATLQQALVAAVLRTPLIKLHLGRRIEPAEPQSLAAPHAGPPDVVIGADGVWSRMREKIPDAPAVRFSGNVAWRFTFARDAVPDFLDRARVTAYLAPRAHLVAYPLKETGGFNLVAIAQGGDPGRTWAEPGKGRQREAMLAQFSGWAPAIRDMLKAAENPTYWPLFEATGGRWQNGRDTVLVGDAAHAMMPFAAQGAAMAIEDGAVLAALLATMPLEAALARYEIVRKARAERVRSRGAFNKFAYHAAGPVRLARDVVLSMRRPERLAADLDWLYGYDAMA